MGSAEILVILLILFAVPAGSAIGALILWGLARGLGKIENATFLNSWGLYWIISLANLVISLVVGGIGFFIMYSIADNMHYRDAETFAIIFSIIFYIVLYALTFFVTLAITKSFWKCTMRQSFMTHLVPLILSIVFMLIGFLLIATAASDYYRYF
jgi:divalent metal cation (Fe/Co/Zn/Cd) transporter